MYSLLLAFAFVVIEGVLVLSVWRLRNGRQKAESSRSDDSLAGDEAFGLADRLVDVHSALKKSSDRFSLAQLSSESAPARQSAQAACQRSMDAARDLAQDLAQLKRPGPKTIHSFFDGHLLTLEAMEKAFGALESTEKKLDSLNQELQAKASDQPAAAPPPEPPAVADDALTTADEAHMETPAEVVPDEANPEAISA